MERPHWGVIRRVSWTILATLASSLTLIGCGSSNDGHPVDDTPKPGLVTADTASFTRVTAGSSSPLFVDALLHNTTTNTVHQGVAVRFMAGTADASFDLQPASSMLVGCVSPDPWAVPPGETKAIRLRVDLHTDPAVLLVACAFDASTTGFDLSSTRMYMAPRTGAAPPADFADDVAMGLTLLLDAPCTPSDCSDHALVQASGLLTGP
jgi:hypothetical protein